MHGNVGVGSIFVTPGGDWKLAGLDFLSAFGEPNTLLVVRAAEPGDARTRTRTLVDWR